MVGTSLVTKVQPTKNDRTVRLTENLDLSPGEKNRIEQSFLRLAGNQNASPKFGQIHNNLKAAYEEAMVSLARATRVAKVANRSGAIDTDAKAKVQREIARASGLVAVAHLALALFHLCKPTVEATERDAALQALRHLMRADALNNEAASDVLSAIVESNIRSKSLIRLREKLRANFGFNSENEDGGVSSIKETDLEDSLIRTNEGVSTLPPGIIGSGGLTVIVLRELARSFDQYLMSEITDPVKRQAAVRGLLKLVRVELGAHADDADEIYGAVITPRPKWECRAEEDLGLSPPEFIAKHYAIEMAAGTLHRGVIKREDEPLWIKLGNWLRTHPMPEGIDIPTLPEWNTRQLAKLEGKGADLLRLYEVARRRKGKANTLAHN